MGKVINLHEKKQAKKIDEDVQLLYRIAEVLENMNIYEILRTEDGDFKFVFEGDDDDGN